jgi:hypothetical protein
LDHALVAAAGLLGILAMSPDDVNQNNDNDDDSPSFFTVWFILCAKCPFLCFFRMPCLHILCFAH